MVSNLKLDICRPTAEKLYGLTRASSMVPHLNHVIENQPQLHKSTQRYEVVDHGLLRALHALPIPTPFKNLKYVYILIRAMTYPRILFLDKTKKL